MVLKIGHRGAMGYYPENTLISFKKALDLNVDIIELDVHICKSGEIVVTHDKKVSNKTFKELRNLNNEKIPILQEVLDLINKKVNVNIELKGKGTAKPVFKVIEEYVKDKNWNYDNFLISSFDFNELKEFYKLNKKVKIGIIIRKIPKNLSEIIKEINAYSINIKMKYITKEFIHNIHKQNLKIFVWTVNEIKDIEKMKDLKVDGIFSNFPDRL